MRQFVYVARISLRVCLASAATVAVGIVAGGASEPVTVQIGTAAGNGFDVVEIPVTLATGGVAVAGVQIDLQLPPDLMIPATGLGRPDCTVNPAIQKDETAFGYQSSGCDPSGECTSIRVIVNSLDNVIPIADGAELFRCRVQIVTAEAGLPIGCANAGASDPNGLAVTTTCTPGGVVIVSQTPRTRTPTATRTPSPTPREPVTVQVGTAAGNAFDLVEIPVTLGTGGSAVHSVQVDLQLPPGLTLPATGGGQPDCTVNPAIQKNGTSFTYQPSGCDPSGACTGIRALVLALDNVLPIADGAELFRCRVQIATAEAGLPIGCANVDASDPDGNSLAAICTPGGVVNVSYTPSTRTPTATRPPSGTPRQPVTVQIGAAAGNAFDVVEIPVTLATGGVAVAGVQIDLQLPPDLMIPATGLGRPDCTVNPAIQKDGTSFAYQPSGCDPSGDCTAIRVLVLARDNVLPIADGAELFRCRVQIATAEAGLPIGCSNSGASDLNGSALETTCSPGGVVIVSQTPSTQTPTATRTPSATPREPVTVQVGTVAGNAFDLVEIPVTLVTGGGAVQSVQVDLQLPPDLMIPATELGRPDCTVNPAIQKGGTSFAYQPSGCDPTQDCTGVRALVLALDNVLPIADAAELFRCRVEVATAKAGLPIGCANAGANDPDGNSLTTTCTPGGVVIVSHNTRTPTATSTPSATQTASASQTDTMTATPTATPTATQTPIRCVGDCDGSGNVVIAELIRGVSIALGAMPIADCPAFDRTGDGEVGVFELINAVSNALTGCAAPSDAVAGDRHS